MGHIRNVSWFMGTSSSILLTAGVEKNNSNSVHESGRLGYALGGWVSGIRSDGMEEAFWPVAATKWKALESTKRS